MANINQLCRACLITKESFTYTLFDNVSPNVYCFCTSVEVFEDEELPRSICNTCYELIAKYSEFKQKCIQSQDTLLSYKKSLKCETDFVNIDTKAERVSHDDKLKTEIVDISVKLEELEEVQDYLETEELAEDTIVTNKIVQKRKSKKHVKLKKSNVTEISTKNKRKKYTYTCDLCRKKFNYKERFEAHKLEHEGKPVSIHCSPCGKTFMTWSGLKRHNESEHTLINLESLKCKTCGKIYKSRQTLKMHEKTHGERRLSVCDVCGRGFTTPVILRAHLETHKENRERRFTCEHCGKKFFTNTILMCHVTRRHTGRRFICQICSYPFTDKYNLAKHLLIHDGKKLYKCDICDKSYATPSTLLEHKRIHSGERPFICSYCPKGFVSKKRLTDHIRIHTGDKPYKCTVCDQRFTQRGTLKRHMKVHDRIVPAIN
ncbi:uncharacterized protein LOC142987653 isoform X2 [Anticarsia gemmatalis]|uniref:uncharacterized protein LOC142987653 isoform X2 n=1 Tax=Anticarsia gemmatalis TaxID=129554 RepID=UPI003F777030